MNVVLAMVLASAPAQSCGVHYCPPRYHFPVVNSVKKVVEVVEKVVVKEILVAVPVIVPAYGGAYIPPPVMPPAMPPATPAVPPVSTNGNGGNGELKQILDILQGFDSRIRALEGKTNITPLPPVPPAPPVKPVDPFNPSPAPAPNKAGNVEAPRDVKAVFQNKCAVCHDSKVSATLGGDFAILDRGNITKLTDRQQKNMVLHVLKKTMPKQLKEVPGQPRPAKIDLLTDEEDEIILKFIDSLK